MIQVIVTEKNGILTKFQVLGHAEAGPYGQDLVCAGVSAVTIGLCNALEELQGNADILKKPGCIEICRIGTDEKTQTILRTCGVQLQMLAEHDPNYITFKKTEE
jgi:uncharacterized protein YsxB (DUF464 family)